MLFYYITLHWPFNTIFLLNCIFNYKVDDYLIKSIFNDSYYFVNEIVTSVTSKKFLENKINGYYLLTKNNSVKLYQVEDDKITEIQNEKYKVYLKAKNAFSFQEPQEY